MYCENVTEIAEQQTQPLPEIEEDSIHTETIEYFDLEVLMGESKDDVLLAAPTYAITNNNDVYLVDWIVRDYAETICLVEDCESREKAVERAKESVRKSRYCTKTTRTARGL